MIGSKARGLDGDGASGKSDHGAAKADPWMNRTTVATAVVRNLGAAVAVAALFAAPTALRGAGAHRLNAWLFVEDGMVEGLGAAAVLAGGVLFLCSAFWPPRPSLVAVAVRCALGLLLIVMWGEEMNWGQRLTGFTTPHWVSESSATGEFNLHNLRQFQSAAGGNPPTSWWQIGAFCLLIGAPLVAAWWPGLRGAFGWLGLAVPSARVALLAGAAFAGMLLATQYGLAAENSEILETVIECLLLVWAVEVARFASVRGRGPWFLPVTAAVILLLAIGFRLATISPAAIQRERALTFTSLGTRLVASDEIQAAEQLFREALLVDPRCAPAEYMRGLVDLKRGQPGAAAEAFQRALAIAPDFAEAHASLGIALVSTQKYAEARKSLERALQLDPQQEQARQVLEQLSRAGL